MARGAAKRKAAGKYLMELVAQFPDAPAMTLAKRAYREHPEFWSSLETARNSVRYILGVKGNHGRKASGDRRFFRAPRKAGFSSFIPEALDRLPWKPVQIDGPARCLILSDIHIPYHDPQTLQVALDYGKQRKANMVLLNGDFCDHFALSRWENDPRERDFPEEVAKTQQFIDGLRKMFGKRIWVKLGNHEERYESYLRIKAPELLGIPNFDWNAVFGVEREFLVDHKRPIRLGKLNVVHGHEYRFAISNPVNAARGLFLRAKSHTLTGHFHQHANHSGKTIEDKVIFTWSSGCLCNLHPEYAPLNEWSHGFAFVEVDRDGEFHVDNVKIIGGKVY